MRIFKLARNCWGGYAFLLAIFWLFLFAIVPDFPRIFTVIMSLGYFSAAYSLGWRAGKRESRLSEISPSLATAFWGGFLGIFPSILSFIIMAIGRIFKLSGIIFDIADGVYTFLHFHFFYFIKCYREHLVVFIVPIILVLLLYPIGYYFGTKKFSFIERYFPKVFYKENNKKDN